VATLVCGYHPVITTVHGSDLESSVNSPIWSLLLKIIFNYVDCVNTCNKVQKRKVISLGIPEEKIRVLTLGVDTEKFSFSEKSEFTTNRKLRLVSTRRLERVYGHFTTIKALAIVRSKGIDFHMTFVASGSLLKELKEQVAQEGLADRVSFLGGINKNEIVEILHNNDVFLSTPLWDGISIALVEAMATGLFPIASDIDINADWINHGVNGFLHKVSDADSLASCILEFCSNPKIAIDAVEYNRRKVVELADTQTNMKILEKIYEELIYKKHK
jgi:glycosyltransferase involved in cell wall biosynthesis